MGEMMKFEIFFVKTLWVALLTVSQGKQSMKPGLTFIKKDTRSSTTSRPLTMQSTRSRVNNLQRLLFLTSSETIINFLFIILSALYLWSQNQKLPTTPGILWERHGNSFRKNIMTTGNSYAALQWLLFAQENGE